MCLRMFLLSPPRLLICMTVSFAVVYLYVSFLFHSNLRNEEFAISGSAELTEIIQAQRRTMELLSSMLKKNINQEDNEADEDKQRILISELETEVQNLRAEIENIRTLDECPLKLNKLEAEIKVLKVENERIRIGCSPQNGIEASYMSSLPVPFISSKLEKNVMEETCEKRYGMSLISSWAAKREVWCSSPQPPEKSSIGKSELVCYPYNQEHRKLRGKGPDIFCEAKNFFIDFSRISGEPVKTGKPQPGSQYLNFYPGSTFSTCSPTAKYRDSQFMPHNYQQMRNFEPNREVPEIYETEDVTTYLLARDEDCENTFHSTADFMNYFLVLEALKIDPTEQQTMLFDNFADGPYMDLISRAFSPVHPPIRPSKYGDRVVLFKRLIFHLESPSSLIFPEVPSPEPMRCFSSSFFQNYRKFVLKSFNLFNVAPPSIPTVTLSLRKRTEYKNVGRILSNEDEVISLLREGNMMKLNVVDLSNMSYYDQLRIIRQSNVLVGVHGAGLMFIMFAAEEAALVEIHPSYRMDRHFRHVARLTGKLYLPLRATQRETCNGTSDNVIAPISELRMTMDGALRLARSFDDGLSECGLVCPPSILSMDIRLDDEYRKLGEQMAASTPDLTFPCRFNI